MDKEKKQQAGSAKQAIKNNLFIMSFAWRICPIRVLASGIHFGLNEFEYLFFSGFFMKKVLSLIETGGSFQEILVFLGLTVGIFFLVFLYNGWYENLLIPVTDVKVHQGLYRTLYEKAGNDDLSCFEDSDFYNQYMLSMEGSDQRLLATINNVWQILIGTVAVAVSWVMMIRIDRWVLLFVLAPIVSWILINYTKALMESMKNSLFIQNLRDFMAYEPVIPEDWDGILPEKEVRSIEFCNVSFAYQPERMTLKNISFTLKEGEACALVGYNGAGKTTLIKLLMRLYDPESGTVLRNGEDIRTLKLTDYRKEIGAVFQDFKLYAASLRENVVMDLCTMRKKETYEVEYALFRAKFNLSERELKYQIETPLTTEFEKDGVNLSGGESQKVAIARTLYRNHDLIIMDEPSSALDPASEYQLNQELRQNAEDKTVIFISHRLATARDADCIYMMKEGRIVEQGTHKQLLELGGEYCRMWELQAQAYR